MERLLGKGKKKRGGSSVDVAPNEPPAPAEDTPAHLSAEQRPRIKTREAVRPSSATPAQGQPAQTASKPAVKTKGTYLQGESAPPTEPPSQAGQVAVREQGRIAARDRAPQRHRPESVSVPRSGGESWEEQLRFTGPILHIRSACASDISRTYRSRKGPVRIKGRSTPSARRGKDRGAHLQADHQDGGSGG
mgnify:CR=1 FL=1